MIGVVFLVVFVLIMWLVSRPTNQPTVKPQSVKLTGNHPFKSDELPLSEVKSVSVSDGVFLVRFKSGGGAYLESESLESESRRLLMSIALKGKKS